MWVTVRCLWLDSRSWLCCRTAYPNPKQLKTNTRRELRLPFGSNFVRVRALVLRSVGVRVGLSSCENKIARAKVYKQKTSDLNDFVFTRVCLRRVFCVIVSVLLCFFFPVSGDGSAVVDIFCRFLLCTIFSSRARSSGRRKEVREKSAHRS